MPALPDILSTQSYAPTPQPEQSPDALTRANDIFTAGMRDVSASLASISGRMTAAKQQSDAADLDAQNAIKLTDMRNRYANDPDPATVARRFEAEATQWQADTLAGVSDPNTRYYVAKNLSHRIPVAYAEISGTALAAQHQANIGTLDNARSTQAQQLAGARNGADIGLAVQGLKSTLAGGVAAGTIDPATGNRLFSASVRQAATIRAAAGDPIGAQSLVTQYAPEMQAADVAEAMVHLRPQVQNFQANGAASAALAAGSTGATRAMAVKQGFIARGIDPEDATALAANAVGESSANPAAVSDDGSGHGLLQLTGARRQQFIDTYHTEPDAANLDQQLDFAVQELHTTEAPAMAQISAAQGVNAKAQAASRYYLRPKAADADAVKRGGIADQLATFGGQPSLPAMIGDVKQRTADLPFEVQEAALSKVIEGYHRNEAGLAPARADLTRRLTDLEAGYEAGVVDPPVPASEINTLLPPAEARRWNEQLAISRNAGRMMGAMKLASPAQEQAARQALAVPGSLAATMPTRTRRIVSPGPGSATAPTDASAAPDLTEQYNTRLSPEDEAKFQAWGVTQAATNGGRNPALDTADYDMRGFWQSGGQFADNGHAGDKFKKPNHPTFSTQSQYNGAGGAQGGTWTGGDGAPYVFTPGATNLRLHGADGLTDYFADPRNGETANSLNLPPTPGNESSEQTRLRLLVSAKLNALLVKKHTDLADDPHGYAVGATPALQQLDQQIDPKKPQTRQTYIDAALQMQAQLGVAPADRRVLTNSQVAGTVKALTSADPASNDIGAAIDDLKTQYGVHFPQAWGELVRYGKLPGDWQVVANMTNPAQAGARVELVRALQQSGQPGGRDRLEKAVPAPAKKDIDQTLSDDLAPFRATVAIPGEGLNLPLYSAVQEAVRTLAYSNAIKGTSDGKIALSNAVDSIINQRYDIQPGGTMRAPKGQLAAAETATSSVQQGLTLADIKPSAAGNPKLTQDQNTQIILDAAHRAGVWMANPRDDGAILVAPLQDGSHVPVIRRDGTPVQVLWNDLARLAPARPSLPNIDVSTANLSAGMP